MPSESRMRGRYARRTDGFVLPLLHDAEQRVVRHSRLESLDGGDYDIDVWNTNNIVQYNYGHDSVGYCVSVFTADNVVSTNNIIRYNVCSNNAQLVNSPDPGEIFMNDAADGVSGTFNGVQVYNNTFY